MDSISETQSKINTLDVVVPRYVDINRDSTTLHCCKWNYDLTRIRGITLTGRNKKDFDLLVNERKKADLSQSEDLLLMKKQVDLVCPGGLHTLICEESGADSCAEHNTFAGGIPPVSCSTADTIDVSVKRAEGVLRGLLVVLQHHGAPQPVVDSLCQQARAYLVHPDEGTFFKRAKYFTVAPMARYLRQEMPKSPDLSYEMTGQWKHWAHARMNRVCRKNHHLWYSFLQSKRAAYELSDELVLTTYEEHRKAMEIKDPIDDGTLTLVMTKLEPVLKRIQKGVEKLLPTVPLMNTPSTSACQEQTRSKGGQAGEIRRLVPGIERCSERCPTRTRQLPDLRRMKFYPILVQDGHVRYNVVVEEYEYTDGELMWRDMLLKECVRYTTGAKLTCTIQAVIEPLKIRVISKGEAVPYYYSKDLQKAMHTVMREMACFRLIGRPLCPTDLIDLAENRCILGSGRYEWFSIDYSAATDNLSARLSAAILHRIVKDFPEETQKLWRSVLAPHFCEYPKDVVASVEQTNGQLMGSILSFPVLCIANLGLYLATIREDSRPLKDILKGVLVNGDDMLYVAKHSLWQDHIAMGEKVGLKMSVGKAYCHPRFANANSACYDFDLNRKGSTPWYVPFLNTGLFFGQSKVLRSDNDNLCRDEGPAYGAVSIREEGFCSTVNRLIAGALPGKAPELLSIFMAKNSKRIDQECRGRNLFVPQSLGGMGVERPYGFETKFTWQQKAVAKDIMTNEPHLWTRHGPLPAPEIDVNPKRVNPWDELDTEVPAKKRLKHRASYEVLKDSAMEIAVVLCRLRRPGAGLPLVHRNGAKMTPEKKFWEDVLDEDIEEDFRNMDSPNFQVRSPWAQIGRELDFCLTHGVTVGEALAGCEGERLL